MKARIKPEVEHGVNKYVEQLEDEENEVDI